MIQRGDMVVSEGGATGLYVGHGLGIDWICYEPERFEAMCAHFDSVVR